ncbi:hypothetical protein COCON_G00086570 [Conger conger]|uniref:Calponin-homology (CH) domain-containing protein n=1 Tax=Conger conger TaxID=82655 RepID=A0A9Q1DK58_CONCO|nr:hypothetical protein COCON_G00086570 [Conger conger]
MGLAGACGQGLSCPRPPRCQNTLFPTQALCVRSGPATAWGDREGPAAEESCGSSSGSAIGVSSEGLISTSAPDLTSVWPHRLINKLQPGSVRKVSQSSQNWHQLENLSNFIKAITAYGLKPLDIFEANDLFESGNMTQVQTTLLALAGMAKTKGLQSGVDFGV